MTITIGNKDYELKTTLGTASKIESKFKLPLVRLFQKIDEAEINELIKLIALAGGEKADEITAAIPEEWDYSELQKNVVTMLTRIMFSGTPEQIEEKIENFPAGEEQKNAFRELLKLPKKVFVGKRSSEQDSKSD